MFDELKVIFKADTRDFEQGQRKVIRAVEDARKASREQEKALLQQARAEREAGTATRESIRAIKEKITAKRQEQSENTRFLKIFQQEQKEIQGLGNATKGIGGAAGGATAALRGMGGALTALGLGLTAVEALKAADAFKQLQGRIKLLTEKSGDFEAVSKGIGSIADATGVSREAVVDLFQSVQRGGKEFGATNTQVLRVVETINKLGAVSGATGASFEAALMQLSQGLASGQLRGEELNSVLEQAPVIAEAIAKELGVSTGQLKALAEQGKITADVVFRALLKGAEDADKAFAKLPTSLDRANAKLSNSFQETLGKLDKATKFTEMWVRLLEKAAEAIKATGDAIETSAKTQRTNYNASNPASFIQYSQGITNGADYVPQPTNIIKQPGLNKNDFDKFKANALFNPYGNYVNPNQDNTLPIDRLTPIQRKAVQAANRYNVDPALVLGVVKQESGFKNGLTSSSGARGLGQFMPGTGRQYGLLSKDDFFNEDKNLDATARYLKDLLAQFNGDVTKAVAAYNAGPGRVAKVGGVPRIAETQNYVKNVLAYQKQFSLPGLSSVKDGGSGSSGGSDDLAKLDNKDLKRLETEYNRQQERIQLASDARKEAARKKEIELFKLDLKEKEALLKAHEQALADLQSADTRTPEGDEARQAKIEAQKLEVEKARQAVTKASNALADAQVEKTKNDSLALIEIDEKRLSLAERLAKLKNLDNTEAQLTSEIQLKEKALQIEERRLAVLQASATTEDDKRAVEGQQYRVASAKVGVLEARKARTRFQIQDTSRLRQEQYDNALAGFDNRASALAFANEKRRVKADTGANLAQLKIDEKKTSVEDQFEKRKIKLQEYYKFQQEIINATYDLEVTKLNNSIQIQQSEYDLLEKKKQELGLTTQEQEKQQDLLIKIKELSGEILVLTEKRTVETKNNNNALISEQTNSRLNALQAFGSGIGGPLGGLINSGINGFRNPGNLSRGGGVAAGLLSGLGGVIQQSGGGGFLGGALSGAASGAMAGGIPGAILGGLLGGVSGGAKGGLFDNLGVSVALLGPLGFLVGGKARRQKKYEKQNAETRKRVEKVIKQYVNPLAKNPKNFLDGLNLDQPDLGQLNTQLTAAQNTSDIDDAVNRLLKVKTKGEKARDAKKAGLDQLQQLKDDRIAQQNQIREYIKQRQKSIDEFRKSIGDQNREIEQQLALGDAKSTEAIVLQNKQLLENLQRDTQRALEQFKDSQEAQTDILRNEALKRQQIEQGLRKEYEASAKQLEQLFIERDNISNSNVFQRAQTAEQKKANDLKEIDKQIAENLAAIKQYQALGIKAPDLASIGQITNAATNITNAKLEVIINESGNTEQTRQQIERAFTEFTQKAYGARPM